MDATTPYTTDDELDLNVRFVELSLEVTGVIRPTATMTILVIGRLPRAWSRGAICMA
jgi:hypothetical protein